MFIVGIYRKNIKFEECEKSVVWSDHEDGANNAVERAESENPLDDTLSPNLNADVEDDEDPIMQVMLKSIQDPDLTPIYEGLPDLGLALFINFYISRCLILFLSIYRSVRQYSYVNTVGMGVVTFKDLQSRVGNDEIS